MGLPPGAWFHPAAFMMCAPGGAAWPLFGRLLLADVEALAGGAKPPPLLRPVALTLVPDRVTTLHEAACALRHAERLCTLLANQAGLLKHSISLRLALLQHLFTCVLPLPLPLSHPARATRCFWAAQPCRYETQADVLALLRLLSRHYAAACLSLKADRALDAARLLTAACMASIADAVARKAASDVPSLFAGHYAGDAPGPLRPYGFTMRRFAAEAEALPLTSPEFATALTQVLDYFASVDAAVEGSHVIFGFESDMKPSVGDAALIDQLCLDVAAPREPGCAYMAAAAPHPLRERFHDVRPSLPRNRHLVPRLEDPRLRVAI